MNNKNNRFSLSLFGYDRYAVNYEVEKIKEYNENKIDNIIAEIKNLKEDNEFLEKIHNNLKIKNDTEVSDVEVLNYAFKKVEEYISLINNEAENEIAKIKGLGLESETLLNKKIEEFNKEIKETQPMLNKLLDEIVQSNDSIDKKLNKFIEEKYNHSALGTKKVGIVLKDSNKLKKEIKDTLFDKEDYKDDGYDESSFWGEDLKNGSEVQGDATSITNKYLIGKITGENLLDKDENIIISKGTIITENVIKIAEKYGKLAELIVNMTVPTASR
jgi:hypothetical protein